MDTLHVSVIQDDLDWQDPESNRKRYDAWFNDMEATDLVVLPEMCSTGFYMEPWHCFETMEGDSVAWMRKRANELNAVVTGSLVMKVDEQFVNRMIWAQPDGELHWYDKKHLFRYGGEHHHFTDGDKRVVMPIGKWRVALFICYDLRFPVFSRNRNDYDLALFVANWPDARQYAWDTLIRARAIENQAFVIGCNRVGEDPIGNTFSGGSAILDYLGQPLVDCQNLPMIGQFSLSADSLQQFKQDFPASLDADAFQLL